MSCSAVWGVLAFAAVAVLYMGLPSSVAAVQGNTTKKPNFVFFLASTSRCSYTMPVPLHLLPNPAASTAVLVTVPSVAMPDSSERNVARKIIIQCVLVRSPLSRCQCTHVLHDHMSRLLTAMSD